MSDDQQHKEWRYYGRRQGAECECRAPFYPKSGKVIDIMEAHRMHVFEVTGLWPEELQEDPDGA